MAKIYAPFTDEQVQKLSKWQNGETTFPSTTLPSDKGELILHMPPHPFTCCSHEGCNRAEQPDEGALIPTNEGWICPCGKYTQNWCHDYMVE